MIRSLNEKQQKKVTKLLDGDARGRYIQLPVDASTSQTVGVLQHDGQKIGEITLAEAFNL